MTSNQLHKQQKQQKKIAAKQQGKPAAAAAAAATAHKQKQQPTAAASTAATPTLLAQLRSADHAFAALLGSTVTPKDFFTKHWEQEPLHISRAKELGSAAAANKFYSGVFSKALFDAYLRKHAEKLAYGFNLK
jgi:outer membrane biosynthesis protein TonB